MNDENVCNIIVDFINHIRFKEEQHYTIAEYYKAIEDLYDLYINQKYQNKDWGDNNE